MRLLISTLVWWISIHALREESDPSLSSPVHAHGNFYPRPPRGERLLYMSTLLPSTNFYPRPPRGERLMLHEDLPIACAISIHALREESDSKNREKIPAFIPL